MLNQPHLQPDQADIYNEFRKQPKTGASKRTARSSTDIDYSRQVADILKNSDLYHEYFHAQYREKGKFRGSVFHFHQRAIETGNSEDFDRHLEYTYATLTAWGMHRLGDKGGKNG